MLIERIYDDTLAQASFLVGCQATGEALVIDPNRDVEQYLRAAAARGLRIVAVTETHIHADFASGSRELAVRAGATLYLSDEGDADWKYAFAGEPNVRLVRHGDSFMVGNLRLDVLHTPGHTPEHVVFVLTDTPATDRPVGVFTGDFVFVGDVGRPDLLEKAAGISGTMEAGARTLWRSLQRFKALPDYLQLWPGHGAGSACGKALGAVPSSTLGYEKLANWGLADVDEDTFVRQVLAGQPEPPRYFAVMKRLNRDGPPPRGAIEAPPEADAAALAAALRDGAAVVDTRPWARFVAGHVPGALSIPLGKSFTTWAGALLPYDRDVYLVVDESRADAALEATRDLALIGLDRVRGAATGAALAASGLATARAREVSPRELEAWMKAGAVSVVDVRGASEYEAGHIPGVPNVPLPQLADRLAELPTGRPLVLQCQGGARSAIATSLLEARGVADVVNLTGGYAAWLAAGLPVEGGVAAAV